MAHLTLSAGTARSGLDTRKSRHEREDGFWRTLWNGLRAWRQRARARAELAALDERMLRDIGLTPSDVAELQARPLWRGADDDWLKRRH